MPADALADPAPAAQHAPKSGRPPQKAQAALLHSPCKINAPTELADPVADSRALMRGIKPRPRVLEVQAVLPEKGLLPPGRAHHGGGRLRRLKLLHAVQCNSESAEPQPRRAHAGPNAGPLAAAWARCPPPHPHEQLPWSRQCLRCQPALRAPPIARRIAPAELAERPAAPATGPACALRAKFDTLFSQQTEWAPSLPPGKRSPCRSGSRARGGRGCGAPPTEARTAAAAPPPWHPLAGPAE